jgi:hypothetical protein
MSTALVSTEKKLEELPIGDEIWLLLVRKLKGFLEDEGKNMRPYCILLYEISPHSHVLDKDILYENLGQFPASGLVWEMIEKQIREPNKIAHEGPRRPRSIIFTSTRLHRDLERKIRDAKVDVRLWTEEENQGFGDEHVVEISQRLREKSKLGYNSTNLLPGLLTVVDKERAASLFLSASLFWKATPWRAFKARETFSVSVPGMGARCYVLASGDSDDSITLGMETDPRELAHLFAHGERATLQGETGVHRCLMWKDEWGSPLDDLDAQEKYQWILPADPREKECFPFAFCFKTDPSSDAVRPSRIDLDFFDIACRAILKFTLDWIEKKVTPENAKDKEYEITWLGDPKKVKVSFYGLDLASLEKDWPRIVEESAPKQAPPPKASPAPVIAESSATGDVCVICGKKEDAAKGLAMKRCGQCKKKLYCSRECQLAHWPQHKGTCIKV